MIVLGIESTAHTIGVAILDTQKKGLHRILSNVKEMATTKKGGMIPVKVAEHHETRFQAITTRALQEAKKNLGEVELISVSNAPGMGHALRIGTVLARALALRYHIPLIGVNHCIAHLEIAHIVKKVDDPILLYCSGANTQVIAYEANKYRLFGETLDTGVGNFLDTLARIMDLGFPGGPQIESLAIKYAKKETLIDFPYSVKGMDVAFSGILTNVTKKVQAPAATRKKEGWSDEAIAYSIQETVFAMLVEVAERALAHTGKKTLVLGGGVACNKRLQEMCTAMCKERGVTCIIPPNQLLVDNAAMIAWCGYTMHKDKRAQKMQLPEQVRMNPYERTDEVEVYWK